MWPRWPPATAWAWRATTPSSTATSAALLGIGLFLHLNGWRLTASQADTTRTMLALAAGELPEDALADWLRQHAAPRS
jgi:prophage maintenance system killer protein